MKRLFVNLQSGIAELHPAYFALVMSTAIISIAFQMQGVRLMAFSLLCFNLFLYTVLWVATLWRICAYPQNFLTDLGSHRMGVCFFTVVAGTCLLGSQFLLVDKHSTVAGGLFVFGFILWLILMYSMFALFLVRTGKPSLAEAISGAWLLTTVSTQTVAVLGALLIPEFPVHKEILLFVSICMFSVGAIFYLMINTLIFYRLMYYEITPEGLTAPYWITMGADSISVLAATVIASNCAGSASFGQIHPFILGIAIFFWAVATWWIPLLLILGIWRYIIKRVPFTYNPGYWGMVYPIGIYTACTWRLAEETGFSFLLVIPRATIYLAMFAYLITFLGMLHSGWKRLSFMEE